MPDEIAHLSQPKGAEVLVVTKKFAGNPGKPYLRAEALIDRMLYGTADLSRRAVEAAPFVRRREIR